MNSKICTSDNSHCLSIEKHEKTGAISFKNSSVFDISIKPTGKVYESKKYFSFYSDSREISLEYFQKRLYLSCYISSYLDVDYVSIRDDFECTPSRWEKILEFLKEGES